RQLPPGIAFGEKRFDVPAGTHPRRVSELEIEAIAFKDCGEVELPVEEALLLGNRFGDVQPRMGLKNCLYSGSSTRQSTLVGFEFVQFRPVVDVEHRCLAGFPGGLLTPRFLVSLAEQLFAGVDHSSMLGGFTSVSVKGQNHSAHHASMTRRRR